MSIPAAFGAATGDDPTRYMGASIPVVCAHLQHDVSVSRARDEIRHAAMRLRVDVAGASTRSLAAKLEHANGCTIEQLAAQAERWPASGQLTEPGHREGIHGEFFHWWFVDGHTGERRLTAEKLSRRHAARAHPGSVPELKTREWRAAPVVG